MAQRPEGEGGAKSRAMKEVDSERGGKGGGEGPGEGLGDNRAVAHEVRVLVQTTAAEPTRKLGDGFGKLPRVSVVMASARVGVKRVA